MGVFLLRLWRLREVGVVWIARSWQDARYRYVLSEVGGRFEVKLLKYCGNLEVR